MTPVTDEEIIAKMTLEEARESHMARYDEWKNAKGAEKQAAGRRMELLRAHITELQARTCDYCGKTGHWIDTCPDFDRDRREQAEADAAVDKSDWPE